MPLFRSSNVLIIKLELGWIISALLLSSQVLWTFFEETSLFQSKWHGWFLVYLSRQSLNRSSNYNSKGEVFKMCQMNSVERLLDTKLNVDSLSQAIEDIGFVGYINLTGDYLVELQDRSLLNIIHHKLSNEEISTIEALIIEHYYINIDGNIQENITIGEDLEYELRCICCTFHSNNNYNKFDAEIYSRHGKHHNAWWYQKRHDYIRRQLDNDINDLVQPNRSYILLYCKIKNSDTDQYRDEYLKYLGGQNKAKCSKHKLCLVRSIKKKIKCSNCSERYEYYRCPQLTCKSCICQTCLKAIDDNGPTQFFGEVQTQNRDNDDVHSHHFYSDDDSNDEDTLEIPYDIDGDYLLNGMYSYN